MCFQYIIFAENKFELDTLYNCIWGGAHLTDVDLRLFPHKGCDNCIESQYFTPPTWLKTL